MGDETDKRDAAYRREEREADKVIKDKKAQFKVDNQELLKNLAASGMSPTQIQQTYKEILSEQDKWISDYTYGTRTLTKQKDHYDGKGNVRRNKGMNNAKGHSKKIDIIYNFATGHQDFSSRKKQQIADWTSSVAFNKLKDDPNVLARKKHLQQGADVGISGAQRKEEAGRVGRAVRGMTPNRKIKSLLAGQGVRGASASALSRKVKGVADKQKANFDMKQMARSYGHKTSSADKLAGLNVDISTFDREQDRSNLKFLTDQEIHEKTLKANALNTAGKHGKTSLTDTMDALTAVEHNMYNNKNKNEE